MRIISGTQKGRKLFTPPPRDKSIRPTSDKAREALFSILGKSIQGAKVLDLFAGTGAIGLEAFSRNADFVVFVENNSLALDLIKKNIALCLAGYTGNCGLRIIRHDLTKGLPFSHFPLETSAGFDFIFADPPYGKNMALSMLRAIDASSLLTENSTIVIEERYNTALPEALTNLYLTDKRVYGENGLWLYSSTI
ncbi:MAG: 16S rRNA (guanine(966)-N(2))-methyltransferase RsmD [Desulforhopalus sp.]|nr:16S rRNA (guanine(966)-N(2))-methyltransferase RsmD [Desulforhopalus sp.]